MAVQVGTVDGLINITPVIKDCFVKAIDSFSNNVIKNNKLGDLSIGDAFQRYTYPVYSGQETQFKLESLKNEVTTKTGNKQSPAFVTYCKKMGLLETDGTDSFELTPVGSALLEGQIELHEYAMLYMSKQGIFKDGTYKGNLLEHIANIFKVSPSITTDELLQSIATKYGDSNFQKTRSDIILGALCAAKILSKVNNVYVLAGIAQAQVLNIFAMNGKNIRPAILDTDQAYADYIGTFKYGIYDFLNEKNLSSFAYLYPNLITHLQENYTPGSPSLPLQQIFYGAPGTGKSHSVKKVTGELLEDGTELERDNVFRTTFHPDTDYASFVGCYKPTMKPTTNEQKTITGKKEEIVYEFVPQVFTDAYVYAYNNPDKDTYLVIEEINRGNCAQIFGDLFQLLDRKRGVSEYKIKADKDLATYLLEAKDDKGNGILTDKIGILNGKLCLPANLNILATMNTSDQSLFPMDSAFKRRWEWEYVVIDYDEPKSKGFEIILSEDKKYNWCDFIKQVNKRIFALTQSEDKEMGNFFIKNSINAEQFKSKVMFYLWYEVLRDEVENSKYFFYYIQQDEDTGKESTKKFTFNELYGDKAETILDGFLRYIAKGAVE